MRRFKYKAIKPNGEVITGQVEAKNDVQAASLVRGKDMVVVDIKPVTQISLAFIKNLQNRVTYSELTNFTRQFATMINAGLPLTEALLILRSQSKGALQRIVAEILADVEEGQSLSKSMSKHPVFGKTYIALIKSGEVGGVLDKVLIKMSDNMEKQQEFKGKVKGAMIYPIIIVIGMLGVAFVMMIFVVPRMTSLYDQFDADLPVTTLALIKMSEIMQKFWMFMLAAIAAGLWGLKAYRKTKKGGMVIDELILKIPLIGDLQKQIVLAEMARTLALMSSSGVSIIESLKITASVSGNKVISSALEDSVEMVEKGFPLAFSFSRHPEAFPFIVSQMISVGEETGKMDEVLEKVSHVFEVESDQKVKTITAAVEPAILMILGVGVAFLVVSIIMPIYNLTTQF